MTTLRLYCGNLDCLSRTFDPPMLFPVPDEQLVDGEVWLCPVCLHAPHKSRRPSVP